MTCNIILNELWSINENFFIYKTETDAQTQKTNLRLPKGKEGEG